MTVPNTRYCETGALVKPDDIIAACGLRSCREAAGLLLEHSVIGGRVAQNVEADVKSRW